MNPPRLPRRAVHGVLLLDKPAGISSNAALQQARRLLRAEKAGHTGTLDPLASGLLPLAFGAATKFAQAGLDADKRYCATLRLGLRTPSGDAETEVVERRPVDVDRAAIDAVIARFTGPIEQRPPMHSALKHRGRALYDYARAGIEVERSPRRIVVHRLEVLAWRSPELVLDVLCSKGTYVRALATDLGDALGCGAMLAGLERAAIGKLALARATTLAALAALADDERDRLLLPPDALLADWPAVRLAGDDAARFIAGLRRRVALPDAPAVRVYDDASDAFLGSGRLTAGELIAERLLSPAEVRALQAAPALARAQAVRAPRVPSECE